MRFRRTGRNPIARRWALAEPATILSQNAIGAVSRAYPEVPTADDDRER